MKSARIDACGIATFFLRCGEGPPVVLIHGSSPGACANVSWKHNIAALAAAGLTVIAYDQPGFGESAVPDDHSMEFRVEHARAFLRALGLERYHLVGNSVGAYIAARIALEDRGLDRLVLVASATLAPPGSAEDAALGEAHVAELSAYDPSLERMRELSLKTLFRRELVTEEFVRERYAMSVGPLHRAMRARAAAPRPVRILDRLAEIASPTLILWGNEDRGAAVERAMPLFRALPNAELHIFRHCAHWVQWDQAAQFNEIVSGFLTTPQSSTRQP